jgi:transketolase
MSSNYTSISNQLRRRILELTHANKASHIGGAFSVIDILTVLYNKILKYDVNKGMWEERDRLFYSKGHACTALYSVLEQVGFYSKADLDSFTQNGSFFTSHVNHKIPGVELSTGSLGHALNVACGVALAGKRKKADWRVYCILSDGELNEGSNWEAILFAPHHKLNNLTLIIDYNKIQSFGTTKDVLDLDYGKNLSDKFLAFGWDVIEIDGHDFDAIETDFVSKNNSFNPSVVIAHTIKGKGVDFMENKLAWHYKSPNDDEMKNAISQLYK